MNLCRHCQQKKANRPRGLCWNCYYTPGLKEHYPSTSKYASRRAKGQTPAPEDFEGRAPLPRRSTDAEPGSEEKIRVLEERARLGLALFHPRDVQYLPTSAAKSQPLSTKIHHVFISVTPYLEDDPRN